MVLERVPDAANAEERMDEVEGMGAATAGIVYRGRPLSFYVANAESVDSAERLRAIRSIGYFGKDAVTAVPELAAALTDQSRDVRIAAAASLGFIGSVNAVPALAKGLSDPDPLVRCLSAIALEAIGPKAAPAVPQLVEGLSDSVNYVRISAADALGVIGAAAVAAVPTMAEVLLRKSEDGLVLMSTAYALGKIGPPAKDALPALRQIVDTRRLGAAAQEAILRIEGKPVPVYH